MEAFCVFIRLASFLKIGTPEKQNILLESTYMFKIVVKFHIRMRTSVVLGLHYLGDPLLFDFTGHQYHCFRSLCS